MSPLPTCSSMRPDPIPRTARRMPARKGPGSEPQRVDLRQEPMRWSVLDMVVLGLAAALLIEGMIGLPAAHSRADVVVLLVTELGAGLTLIRIAGTGPTSAAELLPRPRHRGRDDLAGPRVTQQSTCGSSSPLAAEPFPHPECDGTMPCQRQCDGPEPAPPRRDGEARAFPFHLSVRGTFQTTGLGAGTWHPHSRARSLSDPHDPDNLDHARRASWRPAHNRERLGR